MYLFYVLVIVNECTSPFPLVGAMGMKLFVAVHWFTKLDISLVYALELLSIHSLDLYPNWILEF